MFKQTNKNSFFGYFLYDQIIPKDHFLRRLSAAVDFNFTNELCANAYPNLGKAGNRPYEPAMLFKILFLAFLYNISLCDIVSYRHGSELQKNREFALPAASLKTL